MIGLELFQMMWVDGMEGICLWGWMVKWFWLIADNCLNRITGRSLTAIYNRAHRCCQSKTNPKRSSKRTMNIRITLWWKWQPLGHRFNWAHLVGSLLCPRIPRSVFPCLLLSLFTVYYYSSQHSPPTLRLTARKERVTEEDTQEEEEEEKEMGMEERVESVNMRLCQDWSLLETDHSGPSGH